MTEQTKIYQSKNKIRIVTAAALFDGHDAAINIMRRMIQSTGCEVIHLGHNRSVREIVDCAIQEDVQAIAVTSYQGGHMEFFKYMYDLLKEADSNHIKLFGGGGGVILPDEMEALHRYGITRIYSPDDGRLMGLRGMINHMVSQCDFPTGQRIEKAKSSFVRKDVKSIAQLISAAENYPTENLEFLESIACDAEKSKTPVIGITGTGGAGKSSLVDELVRRFLQDFDDKSLAVISVDPSKRRTGGALLGDRIRMNAISNDRVYMRSLATRQSNLALSKYVKDALNIVKVAGFDLIILETSGIGQSDTEIVEHSDISMYVMTPEYGAGTQLEKIDMLDFADMIVLNKFDKRGAEDALREVKRQVQRNQELFETDLDLMPVYGTIASQFNDPGTNTLYLKLIDRINQKSGLVLTSNMHPDKEAREKVAIIPAKRVRYLAEIAENNRSYDDWVDEQSEVAQQLYGIDQSIKAVEKGEIEDRENLLKQLEATYREVELNLEGRNRKLLENWEKKKDNYKSEFFLYKVRDKEIKISNRGESISHTQIPKISLPRYKAWGDILKWNLQENVPGEFPYTAGLYPFKREGEDPTRMFAGEGGPERTNRRFHYVSKGLPATRLSTAYDSVSLYGNNPNERPDIYGKIGNAGVSICCLDDSKKLYSGFDLADPKTSVSMTINGPSPTFVAYYMNTAIDQQCEIYIQEQGLEKKVNDKIKKIYQKRGQSVPVYQGELPPDHNGLGLMLLGVTGDQVLPAEVYEKIKAETISVVRGTTQADILKEDQAQNTCVFSTEFALRLMGDVQEFFIKNRVRNFYSVSISGYHIAEAGANPISQVAFTLANGFT
ncbi:MAG: methylmalonyl-CoA mutase family protein, partial [Proteobacteria bacterium]|nr:methylmalonyl-CoA mutase family protein [Pseudomonadota bacterium]